MRYRIGKAQIKMLLDGKTVKAGRINLIVPKEADFYKRLEELYNDPETFEKKAFFTDGVVIFVEDKA